MTTILELPIQSLDNAVINGVREKYPHAIVRFETEELPSGKHMDEAGFWKIISLLDWKKSNNADIAAPAIQALSQYPVESITSFDDLLAEKLYALDGQKFAEQTGSNSYSKTGGNYFSVDVFLYARCCVVANGKKFYEKVLQNPALMPKEYTFEPLLYLAEKAWRLKTGSDDYDHLPDTWYETFSNPEGWHGIVPLKDRILNSR